MALSTEFKEYVIEQIESIYSVNTRSAFDDVEIFPIDVDAAFAFISSLDELYFRVDEVNQASYKAAGGEQYMNQPYFSRAH